MTDEEQKLDFERALFESAKENAARYNDKEFIAEAFCDGAIWALKYANKIFHEICG